MVARRADRAGRWLAGRFAMVMLTLTASALLAGLALRLAGMGGAGNALWAAAGAAGAAYALWAMADAFRHGRVGVDVIAVLALAGALAVGELLAAAVISVMLASGRALEAWAAGRARRDLRALLERAPRTARRHRDGALQTVPADQVVAGDLLLVAPAGKAHQVRRCPGKRGTLDEAHGMGKAVGDLVGWPVWANSGLQVRQVLAEPRIRVRGRLGTC